MSKQVPTSEKLAKAMEKAGCPEEMIQRARDGYYDDYKSDIMFPIRQLVADLRKIGKKELARQAMDGKFDAQKWESDEWAASPEGQQIFKEFLHGVVGRTQKRN